jgi:ABC-type transporter Mla MlaB component
MKIATENPETGPVTLAVAGSLSTEGLVELEAALERARDTRRPVRIDLSEVTLVDRNSLQFLAAQRQRNIQLVNCPEYIEPWIYREHSK